MRKLKMEELNRLSTAGFKAADKMPFRLVLDDIRSANNVGSIFRTADCFRIEGIDICGYTPFPPNRDIQKTALGATETVNWRKFEHTETCLQELKIEGYILLAIEQSEQKVMLHEFLPEKHQKYALILGNEVSGVSDIAMKMADQYIEIPQFGAKHSFNVSVCAGIVLWEMVRKYSQQSTVDSPQ